MNTWVEEPAKYYLKAHMYAECKRYEEVQHVWLSASGFYSHVLNTVVLYRQLIVNKRYHLQVWVCKKRPDVFLSIFPLIAALKELLKKPKY